MSAQVNGTNGEVWSGADGGGGVWDVRRDPTGDQVQARLDNTQPSGAAPLDVDVTIRC